MRRSLVLTCALLFSACAGHGTPSQPASPYTTYGPCVPLPEADGRWHRESLPAYPLSLLIPPDFQRRPDGRGYATPDSLRGTSSYPATLTFRLALAGNEPADSTGATYIDGVPVAPGGRSAHSPYIERRCTVTLAGRSGLLELSEVRGWSNGYAFSVRLALADGQELIITGTTPSMGYRDTLLAAVNSLQRTRAI